MFSLISAKYLKLEHDLPKVVMMLITMYVDFLLIIIILEWLGVVGGKV
jgi:hypothetical protein